MRIFCFLLLALMLWSAPAARAQDETGTGGFLGDLLQDALTGENRNVQVTGLSGALSSSATLKRLTIADTEGIWLIIEEAELDWSRAALLKGALDITTLRAKRIELRRLPGSDDAEALPDPEATPVALPELPVSVNIGTLAVDRFDLGEPVLGLAAQVSAKGRLALIDGRLDAGLDIRRQDRPGDQIELVAKFDGAERQMTLELGVREASGGLMSELLSLPGRPSLALTLSGSGPVSDFTADLRLATQDIPRLSGQIRLQGADGAAGRIGFEADVAGDVTALFAPEYRPFFGANVALVARGSSGPDGQFDLPQMHIETQVLTLDGALRIAPGGLVAQAELTGEIADRAGNAPVLLPLSGVETRLARAALKLSFDADAGQKWQVNVEAREVARSDFGAETLSLTGQGQFLQGDGPLQIAGRLLAAAQGISLPDPAMAQAIGPTAALAGKFDYTAGGALVLQDTGLRAGDLSVNGHATLDGFDLSGRAEVAAPDLSRFAPLSGQRLRGGVEGTVAGSANLLSGAFDIEADTRAQNLQSGIAQIDALLDGPAGLKLAARRDETGTHLRALRLTTAALLVQSQGHIRTGAADLTLSARLDDLGRVLPALPGPMQIDGQLQQDGTNLTAALRLDGPGETGGTLDARTNGNELRLNFDGALDDLAVFVPALRGTLTAKGTARRSGDGAWNGTADTDGDAGLSGRFSGGFTETSGAGYLRFDAGLDRLERLVPGIGGTLRAQGRAQRDDAGRWMANAVTTGNAGLSGTFKAAFVETSGAADVYFDAALARIERLVPDISGTLTAFGEATRRGDLWKISADTTGPGGIAVAVQGSFDQAAGNADLTARGQAQLGLANAALQPNSISGTANLDLALRGAPGLQALSGAITTSGARLVLPGVAQTVENLNANVTLSRGQAQLTVSGSPRNGGQLRVQGPVALSPPFDATLGIELIGLGLTNNLNFESSASGRLRLAGPLTGGALLSGRIDFGPTQINIAATSGSVSAAPIPPIAHVGEPFGARQTRARAGLTGGAAAGSSGPVYGLDLVLNAPARIFARGRGLNAELGGSLTVRGTTARVVPSGRIGLIRGTFDILGRRLQLDEGQIALLGSLDPILRFVATTSTSQGQAILSISGPLSGPAIEITSVPERPSEEALALLLFGDKFAELSPLKIAQLASQLATLSGRGGGVTGRLRQSLGLDSLDLGTDDDGTARVGVGAYLAEGVYTDVAVNARGETEVTLNYDLSDTVTLKGSVDSEGDTGIGLFFEKDY